jgi:hypothetical protein
MLMHMKKHQTRQMVLVAGAFVSSSLLGCHNQSINRNALAGRYEYHSGSRPQGTVCFVLNSDGGYVLGDANEPRSQLSMSAAEAHGTWELSSDATGQKLIIGKSSLPVGRKGTSIRVTVNDDLGMYCDLAVTR